MKPATGLPACRQLSPLNYELGVAAMPTINDEGEEEEEAIRSVALCWDSLALLHQRSSK